MQKTNRIKSFARDWALPLSMTAGALSYFAARQLPLDNEAHQLIMTAISQFIQPVFIFCMLFLSFLKVSPREMRPQRWHLWVLLLQAGCFIACSLLAMHCHSYEQKILCEGAMLAFICPTATASAVITGKLGGSTSGVVTYLIICNLMVSLVAPTFLPMVEPRAGLGFSQSFLLILGKVLPLLIAPLVAAQLVRRYVRPLYRRLMNYPDLAFNLWVISLALAIAVTVRSIAHTSVAWHYMAGLAFISGICCLIQFWSGKKIGSRYGQQQRITAGQAFGQKNTVFVIWMGLVFLDPVTSVIGGFYSVWHNIVNSYQLYKARHKF